MTNREVFYKKLKHLNLTKLQEVDIKIMVLEFARDEWKDGYEKCEEITKKTLSILK